MPGLEDVGSFLYKQGVTLHEFLNSINERALERTYDYYKRFRAFHLDRSKLPRDTEARAVMIDRVSVEFLLLHVQISHKVRYCISPIYNNMFIIIAVNR